MVMLQEVLDRIELPPYEQIPGREQVEKRGVLRWTVPGTLIDIVKIEEGPDAGEFLVSKETVADLGRYYELAKDLPYKPTAQAGLYEELRASPGPLIPKRWIDGLPAWTKSLVFSYPVWQWATLLAMFVIALVLVRWLFRWGSAWDDRTEAKGAGFQSGLPLALLGTIVVAASFRQGLRNAIWLFGVGYDIISFGVWAVVFACAVALVVVVTGRLGVALMQQRDGDKRIVDPALTRLLFRLLGIVLAAFILIYAAEFLGLSIAPLVAGLGVGGLALALAIRPTLENVIGGFTLFADRPVRVGDFCRYGSDVGMVHEIGLRSTRIRSLERTLVTIPNAEFSQMKLENFALRDTRLLRTTLQLRYETTMDQLRYLLAEPWPSDGYGSASPCAVPRFRRVLAGRGNFRVLALPGSEHLSRSSRGYSIQGRGYRPPIRNRFCVSYTDGSFWSGRGIGPRTRERRRSGGACVAGEQHLAVPRVR
jgi:MscS family membrane protein